MKILLLPEPAAPYGEDGFCREFASRAAAHGHQTLNGTVPTGAPEEVLSRLLAGGFGRDVDAVLINGFQAPAIRAARAAGTKCAVRLIESFIHVPESLMPPIRDSLRQADRLLVPSQYLARLIESWNGGIRTSLVPYAYDQVRAHQIALTTMRASRPADFQIATTCKFTEACRPGMEMLLAAASRLRFAWHLIVIGDGPILPALRERARQFFPEHQVDFSGGLPHLKVMEIFRSAKAYVDPTGLEGFPAMALYSLAEGCPVVAPRAGAVCELLSDGKNALLFEPGDPASLAQALVKLSSVKGLSLQLISEGVATAHGQTWDATVRAACSALEELTR